MVGWLIIGVCLIAVMILWYQFDKKEREFQKWIDEVKRRGKEQAIRNYSEEMKRRGETSGESKRNGED